MKFFKAEGNDPVGRERCIIFVIVGARTEES